MITSHFRRAASVCLCLVIALSPVFGVSIAWADSSADSALAMVRANLLTSDNLPGGTSISVDITAPSDGAVKVFPPGSIDLEGIASVAEGVVIKNTTVVYVLDRSGSMFRSANVDCTGDGVNDNRDVCAQFGIAAANTAAADAHSAVGLTGIASFGNTGSTHDVDQSAGAALLVAPNYDGDGNNTPDLEDVAFTLNALFANTNYSAGLQSAFDILNDPANTSAVNLVFFISDADNTSAMVGPNISTLAASVPANTTIRTFGIGQGPACGVDGGTGSLDQIAALSTAGTGGCSIVEDISELGGFITDAIGSKLTKIERQLDSGPFVNITASANPAIPTDGLDGPTGDVAFSEADISAAPGIHELCVRATGTDGGGEGFVTDCIEVTVATIDLLPPTATNELGVNPPQTHTVTAVIAAGADGRVANVTVNFNILSGPNAGASGSGITDSNGETTFTYTAVQGLAGLGTDVIEACFGPDEQGDTACDRATKNWVNTAPVAACTPTTNPSGKNVPSAGKNPKSGQNPDGFYEITVKDLVDPNPQVFIHDSGSSFVAGPYTNGTKIKLVQAPGAQPKATPGTGLIDWQIMLKGDAILVAVNTSGNTSSPLFCNVPPPPK